MVISHCIAIRFCAFLCKLLLLLCFVVLSSCCFCLLDSNWLKLYCIALLWFALPCVALHYIALRCITLHCIALHYIALHYIALHCIALHCITLPCVALHYIALRCLALHCITLHCIALHRSVWKWERSTPQSCATLGIPSYASLALAPAAPLKARPRLCVELVHLELNFEQKKYSLVPSECNAECYK
jgi:hypothetical protein